MSATTTPPPATYNPGNFGVNTFEPQTPIHVKPPGYGDPNDPNNDKLELMRRYWDSEDAGSRRMARDIYNELYDPRQFE